MNKRLRRIVDEVRQAYGMSGGLGSVKRRSGDVIAPDLALTEILLAQDLENAFSEEDMVEAYKRLGLSHDDALDAIVRLSSWWE